MVLHVVTSLLGGVPLCNSLGIVQWNPTRRDHPGNPGGVSGSGLVMNPILIINYQFVFFIIPNFHYSYIA